MCGAGTLPTEPGFAVSWGVDGEGLLDGGSGSKGAKSLSGAPRPALAPGPPSACGVAPCSLAHGRLNPLVEISVAKGPSRLAAGRRPLLGLLRILIASKLILRTE